MWGEARLREKEEKRKRKARQLEIRQRKDDADKKKRALGFGGADRDYEGPKGIEMVPIQEGDEDEGSHDVSFHPDPHSSSSVAGERRRSSGHSLHGEEGVRKRKKSKRKRKKRSKQRDHKA
jgi:hypothetical protein